MLASIENSKENFKNKNNTDYSLANNNTAATADSTNKTEPTALTNRSNSLNGNMHHVNGFVSLNDISAQNMNTKASSSSFQLKEMNQESNVEATDLYDEFDGLVFKDLNNSSNTLKMLNVLRKNRQLCDLILQLDDDSQDIYCHQVILACNSKFFMEIFNNYEMEEKIDSSIKNDQTSSNGSNSTENNNAEEIIINSVPVKKHSLQAIVNKNHNTSQRQLLFCLSDYLRNYLSDSHHHHHAKINNVVNHNSHYHHHHYHHMSSTNHHSYDNKTSVGHDKESNHINHNLDYEALKLCIDYMYTSKLKVPSYLLPHVYTLAYHLSIDSIVQACVDYLTKHLNVDNCLSIRSFALDENLIQASTQSIEKNIEYILRLGPNKSISSSTSSLFNSTNGGNNNNTNQIDLVDLTNASATLSSSLNLANKEFNHLPRINIELVGLKSNKYKLPECILNLTELCMNWLVNELGDKQNDHNLNDLCGHLNMLYMNNTDHQLHDCFDMDSSDRNYSDYINDYQKHHSLYNIQKSLLKQNGSTNQLPVSIQNSRSPSPSPFGSGNRLKTFKITDQELNAAGTATPIKVKVLHDNEVVCTHQTSENSFITICTLTGKLVTLSVHLLPVQLSNNCDEAFTTDSLNNSMNGQMTNMEQTRLKSDSDRPIFRMGSNDSTVESQFSLDQQNNRADNPPNSNPPKQPEFNSLTNGIKNAVDSSSSNLTALDYEKLPKMTVARCSHGVIAYDNKLYVIGGYDRGECLDMCEVYDPLTNKIERIESMVNRRGRAAITWFQKENSIYAMGGSDGHEDLNSIECYNLEKKSWTSIKFDFELSCSNLGTIACQNFIYLVGLKGDGGKSLSRSSCLKYDPIANTFIRMAELNHGRSQSALVWVPFKSRSNNNSNETINAIDTDSSKNTNFCLYVFGGHDQIRCLSSCEVYDPREDKWSLITSMHEPRRGCGAVYHAETQSIYIVGGTNGSQSLKSVEIYNTITKRWSMGPDLNIARTNVAIAFIGNILFAVGGFNGKSFLRTIEYLDCNDLNIGWSMFHKPANFDFIKNNSD